MFAGGSAGCGVDLGELFPLPPWMLPGFDATALDLTLDDGVFEIAGA